jgi:hypothetical protein
LELIHAEVETVHDKCHLLVESAKDFALIVPVSDVQEAFESVCEGCAGDQFTSKGKLTFIIEDGP